MIGALRWALYIGFPRLDMILPNQKPFDHFVILTFRWPSEMFVSKSGIFHFYREVHSDAVTMHCRTTFFEPSKKVKCLFVIEFLLFLYLVFSYATART